MAEELSAQVCVVGGGPAGLTLGLELARRGTRVVVVEQSGHFNRSFRGESVSPDSVWLLDQLGLLDQLRGSFLEMRNMEITDGGRTVLTADFSTFPYPHPYPVELPQPALLTVLAEEGARHEGFTLLRRATAVELLRDGDTVTGVRCSGPDGPVDIHAALTVAADGRFSKVREMSGLSYTKIPLDRDVVWLKLPFPTEWDDTTYRVRIKGEHHGLFIPTHPDDVRVGFNIPKGGLKALRAEGIGALHRRLDELAPELSDAVRAEIRGWSDTSMLDIFTTLVPEWSMPGLLLIGDSAHTLSPILGQGVNHAIIDAVTLAPMIAPVLGDGPADHAALMPVLRDFQQRREGSIARSRGLQLRQERMFALSGTMAVAGRRALYRLVDRSPALKQKILAGAYFQLQEPLTAAGRPANRPTPTKAGV
ncbi:FAD-dependent oxidoreductase [Kitasatospora herbaricolor]|uniref:FAD-dependent oxidoreductase n=1 Tax=Kitasatospora herbaricolor TaxID=68217 RepID=UPI002E31A33F|nr:FAD-dependent oxidoreductase [Kitasatospora herbaricolor]